MGESRQHAILSPSGASRWMTCTPSARLEQQFPDSSGDAAREGTLAHAICEIMLKVAIGIYTTKQYCTLLAVLLISDIIEDEETGKRVQEFYCPSMREYCEQYTAFVMEQYAEVKAHTPSAQLFIEERLYMHDWAPECFGTGDVGIGANGVLKIIDLKYGKGVEVSAVNNSQLKVYALGWLREFDPLYDIEYVEMFIFQPRIDNYSSWTISVSDLLKWAEEELKPKALLAFEGTGDFVAGSQCQFCRAKTSCKTLANYNLELAKYEFADSIFLDDFEISDILLRAATFKNWIGAIEEHALTEAVKKGKVWPGFKLVEGRSNRFIENEKAAIAILRDYDYTDDDIYKKAFLGIGDLESLVGGKKPFNKLFAHLIQKPRGKPTLVPESDQREVYSSAANILANASKEFDDDYLITN